MMWPPYFDPYTMHQLAKDLQAGQTYGREKFKGVANPHRRNANKRKKARKGKK